MQPVGIVESCNKREYICDDCKKIFFNLCTLKSQQSNDCGKTFSCPYCRKLFPYRASFNKHKKNLPCRKFAHKIEKE